MKILGAIVSLFLLAGCAHAINITPNLRALTANTEILKTPVGYYLSPADRDKQVSQPSGGGDSVTYYPYKELEPALQKVLYERFKVVHALSSPPTERVLAEGKVDYAFIPEFITENYSTGVLTWPPTKFIVKCSMRAVDKTGTVVWSKQYEGTGEATSSDWKQDFGIAAKRAAESAFKSFAQDINSPNVFILKH